MNSYLLVTIILVYLGLLFLIAFLAEKNCRSKWINNPYIYALSLGVFCSAWTYYGSVGIAATSGLEFLPTYLGPVIAAPLWIVVLRKIIRISKHQKITSVADFISVRYANNRFLGALTTVICLAAIVPYISLQLKAISETFQILAYGRTYFTTSIFSDTTFYIAVILALFAAFYGTQTTDATDRRVGIVASVAFESVIKLVFFLCIGIYITYFVFDGTEDIYNKMNLLDAHKTTQLSTFQDFSDGFNWFYMTAISFIAIFLLPRQFQMAVIENDSERYLKVATWMFPLYMFLFNIFVLFIAWGGNLTFDGSVNPDYYTLSIPLQQGRKILATFVFIGGFSAVISMVVVSTLALSTMVSNNLIIPYGFLEFFSKGNPETNAKYIKNIRRLSIFTLIIGAYLFYVNFSIELSLFSIGYISFVIIAQLAPSFFIGLYWNRGSARGAKIGILVGFLICVYTLILPFVQDAIFGDTNFIQNGIFGITMLRPYALFGINFLNPLAHAFFWSIFLNTLAYLTFSLLGKGNYRERNYAEMFVRSNNYTPLAESAFVWKGEAYVADIRRVLERFLGEERTNRALDNFYKKYNLPSDTVMADARLINFSEKLLSGSIGGASSKILISSVIKEEPVSLVEVLKILEESKEAISSNKFLQEKSDELTQLTAELQMANDELVYQDKLKDEFLDTVAHELKTPITAIKAAGEVLQEADDMPMELKKQFLANIVDDAERLSRLIHNILDVEKLSSGREELDIKSNNIQKTIAHAIHFVDQMALEKGVKIINSTFSANLLYDEDRIIQVFTNLLSNAIKFVEENEGVIKISAEETQTSFVITVEDNGKGIPEEDFNYIFDKFYQSKNQNTKKPQGSGFGLAICKHIMESHKGEVWAAKVNEGAKFYVKLPK